LKVTLKGNSQVINLEVAPVLNKDSRTTEISNEIPQFPTYIYSNIISSYYVVTGNLEIGVVSPYTVFIDQQAFSFASPIGAVTVLDVPLSLQPLRASRTKLGIDVLLAFMNRAKEMLASKKITMNNISIREWQATDNSNWKQCILDITLKTTAKIALSVWDDLTQELEKYIHEQPEHLQSFIEESISIDVQWA
jgi:hypothetical protein